MRKKRRKLFILIVGMTVSILLTGCSSEFYEQLLTELLASQIEEVQSTSDMDTEIMDESNAETELLQTEEESEASSDVETVVNETTVDGFLYPKIRSIEVSSKTDDSHSEDCLMDGDEMSSWLSAENDTENSWIKINFDEEFTLSDIVITNGISDDTLFESYGRVAVFELIFDDGTSEIYDIKSSGDRYWSSEIIPHKTKSIEIRMMQTYPGNQYNQLAISEIELFYNANNYFVLSGMGDLPVSNDSNNTASSGQSVEYTPDWWEWTPSGYSSQDMDNYYLRAGKWVSEDGQTVLYLDYSGSPDSFSYGLYDNGTIYDAGASLEWTDGADGYFAYSAEDWESGDRFEMMYDGVMNVIIGGNTKTVYLERQKYDIYEQIEQ